MGVLNKDHWAHEVDAAIRFFGGACTTTDVADFLLWGSHGTGTEGAGLREFLTHERRFRLKGISVTSRQVPLQPAPALDAFDHVAWSSSLEALVGERGGVCTTRDVHSALLWGSPSAGSYGVALREFLSNSKRFAIEGFAVRLADVVAFDTKEWLERLEAALLEVGGECRTVDLAEKVPWGSASSGTEGRDVANLRELLKLHPHRFELRGNFVRPRQVKADDPRRALAARSFDEDYWRQHVEATVQGFGGQCTTQDIMDKLHWDAEGAGADKTSLRKFIRSVPGAGPRSRAFRLKADTVVAEAVQKRRLIPVCTPGESLQPAYAAFEFNETLWLHRVRRVVYKAGGKADLQDVYSELGWGAPRSPTHGRSLRNFLMGFREHFKVEGSSVLLRDPEDLVNQGTGGATIAPSATEIDMLNRTIYCPTPFLGTTAGGFEHDAQDQRELCPGESAFDGVVWFQRVGAVVERLGGICTTTDIVDALLWGSADNGTRGKRLRDFLRANARHFRIDGTLVSAGGWEAEPWTKEAWAAPQFDRLLEVVIRSFGGTCSVHDIQRTLNWGAPGSSSRGVSLIEFLASQPQRFNVGGDPTPGSQQSQSAASVSLVKNVSFDEPMWLQRIAAVVSSSDGQCTTQDLYTRLDWGCPESSSRSRVLRLFLAHHGDLFAVDGFSVSLREATAGCATCRIPSPEAPDLLRRLETAIISLGGQCRTCDLSRELRWNVGDADASGTTLRAFLRAHPERFTLSGGSVGLRLEVSASQGSGSQERPSEALSAAF